jgi:cytochrome c6
MHYPASRILPFAGVFIVSVLFGSLPLWAQEDSAGLFKTKCAVCHGADGSADTSIGKSLKMRDLRSGEVQKQSDADLHAITACGKGKMPAYKAKLSDDQIKQLVSYIRVLGHKT